MIKTSSSILLSGETCEKIPYSVCMERQKMGILSLIAFKSIWILFLYMIVFSSHLCDAYMVDISHIIILLLFAMVPKSA